MTDLRRKAPQEMFYFSSSGITTQDILQTEMSKLGTVLNHVRKWIDASFVYNNNESVINDKLTGWGFGTNAVRSDVREINDYANTRLRFQKNTGTDDSPVWVDLLTVLTISPYTVTMAGGFVAGGNSIVQGSLTLGGNLDLDGFYLKNLGGLDNVQITSSGRTFSQVFSGQTSVTVNHNLNTLLPIVTVKDSSTNKFVLPQDVEVTSVNQVIVTFDEAAASGTIFVAGGVGVAGITFADGTETIPYSARLQLNPSDFYLTLTGDGNGYAVLNSQPRGGVAIEWNDSRVSKSTAQLFFNPDQFYINSNKPTLNLGDNQTFETVRINQYTDLVNTPLPASPATGRLRLHATARSSNHTSLEMVDSNGLAVDILRDNTYIAQNNTGSTIFKGQAVYFNGSSGGVPTIALAKADALATATPVALAFENITTGNSGSVVLSGEISGFDLSAFTNGDLLYLSATAAGSSTNVAPSHPNISVRIGTVLSNSATNGIISVVPGDVHTTDTGTIQTSFTIGATAATSVVLAKSSTAQRTATFPDKSGIVAFTSDIQPGFYGMIVKETDGNPPNYRTDTISFSSNDFYLNSDSVNHPIVSYRHSRARKSVINFGTAAEWQAAHNFGSTDLVFNVFDNRQIALTPQKADFSDPNTAYFYFATAKSGKAVIIMVGG